MAVSYEFGPFRWDSEQRVLSRDGIPVPLPPKLAETLAVLVEAEGAIVDKTELMRRVWPDTHVEDVGLARNISLLRKALGDEIGETVIVTVPRRGYQVGVPVQRIEAELALPAENSPAEHPRVWMLTLLALTAVLGAALIYFQFYRPGPLLPQGRSASVAVIPFDGDSGQPQFSDLISSHLSRLDFLYVQSQATIGRYRKFQVPLPVMSRLLALDGILEGKVQQIQNRAIILVTLTDVHSGKLIWSSRYESPNQGELRLGIAERIAADLTPFLRR